MVTIIDKKRKGKTIEITFTKFIRIYAKITCKNEFRIWTNS